MRTRRGTGPPRTFPPVTSWKFRAPIEMLDFGRFCYRVIYVPDSVAGDLRLADHPRLRVDARIARLPLNAALQPSGGRWYVLLSRRFLREAGAKVGDEVEVTFTVAADQAAVEVPAALAQALRRRADARALWEALTPGRRRGLAHRVAQAKRAETVERRVIEVLEFLADHVGGK